MRSCHLRLGNQSCLFTLILSIKNVFAILNTPMRDQAPPTAHLTPHSPYLIISIFVKSLLLTSFSQYGGNITCSHFLRNQNEYYSPSILTGKLNRSHYKKSLNLHKFFLPLAQERLLSVQASRSHSDTPQSAGLLWTSDRPEAETSAWRNTTLTRDRHPSPRRNSNQQFQ
jgi:hypothetical protein